MGQKKWSTVVVTAIIATVIVGGGVYMWQNKQTQPDPQEALGIELQDIEQVAVATEDKSEVYDWKSQGIIFNYPVRYNVLKRNDDSLFITTATELAEGDVSTFATLIEIDASTSLEERLAKYSTERKFSQTTKIIGGHEFTEVTLYADFGGYSYTRYLLEFNGKLLDYKVGKNDQAFVIKVLESIQF